MTAGQSEITSHAVRRLLDAGAVDCVNFDASEGGGVTEWRRAAALCEAAGVKMAHHEEPQIARPPAGRGPPRHLRGMLRRSRSATPPGKPIWANRPAVKDGTFEIPDAPGFGLALDETMIRRYRV